MDSLTKEELEILDMATIDYNRAKATPVTKPEPQTMAKTAEVDLMYDGSADAEQPTALVDAPAYWWLSSGSS